ncbi:MAG: sigma-54 dependent transcriptional regulator [Bdellovibrionota bacterium]
METLTLLAIDDDQTVLQSLKLALGEDWRLVGSNSPTSIPEGFFHAAFVDMHLTGNLERAEGLDVIKKLRERDSRLEIVAMSGDLDRDLMEKCLKAGATRFLAKPLSLEEIRITLSKIEALILLQNAANRHPDQKYFWIGQGPASQNVRRQIAFLRGENGPILIEGESGTGKEVAAHLIHIQEPHKPMVTLNVAAVPENLFEAELFGHTKGAFTGADKAKIGLAEAAHGGDLFLDEVEALPMHLQAKLLRFLESGEIRRVGANESTKVNVRVIAASNRNLEDMVKKGEFREDLLWRLNGKKITLPPLRERKEDIQEIADWFLALERGRKKDLSSEAITCFKEYNWPGNIRELRRVCEQLDLISPLPVIQAEDVLSLIRPQQAVAPMENIDLTEGLNPVVEKFEAQVILGCLKKLNDVDEAARVLKVSRSNLYKKIKDLDIDWRPA